MSDDVDGYDLVKTRTAITEAETQLAYLKLRIRSGELLDRRKVTAGMADMGHRHRDLLLSLPARHAHILAADAGVSGRSLLAMLDRLVERELREIAAAGRALRERARDA
jgi:hypothetical protein